MDPSPSHFASRAFEDIKCGSSRPGAIRVSGTPQRQTFKSGRSLLASLAKSRPFIPGDHHIRQHKINASFLLSQ